MIWVFVAVLGLLAIVYIWSFFSKRAFVRLFTRGNVIVSGLRGRGKDFAFCVVVNARKRNYISNVCYSDPRKRYQHFPLDLKVWELSGNTYEDLVTGNVKKYCYPYPDGIDWYISDAGIYFPASYHNELAKRYKSATMFQALSRHLGDCSVHCNCQVQDQLWDKIRKQSDTFIVMKDCRHIFGKLFFLSSRVYERAESAEAQIEPPHYGLGRSARDAKYNFEIAHGKIAKLRFFVRLPYRYDSRRFKRLLENNLVDYEEV